MCCVRPKLSDANRTVGDNSTRNNCSGIGYMLRAGPLPGVSPAGPACAVCRCLPCLLLVLQGVSLQHLRNSSCKGKLVHRQVFFLTGLPYLQYDAAIIYGLYGLMSGLVRNNPSGFSMHQYRGFKYWIQARAEDTSSSAPSKSLLLGPVIALEYFVHGGEACAPHRCQGVRIGVDYPGEG